MLSGQMLTWHLASEHELGSKTKEAGKTLSKVVEKSWEPKKLLQVVSKIYEKNSK